LDIPKPELDTRALRAAPPHNKTPAACTQAAGAGLYRSEGCRPAARFPVRPDGRKVRAKVAKGARSFRVF
jgi:hypothetical protein